MCLFLFVYFLSNWWYQWCQEQSVIIKNSRPNVIIKHLIVINAFQICLFLFSSCFTQV